MCSHTYVHKWHEHKMNTKIRMNTNVFSRISTVSQCSACQGCTEICGTEKIYAKWQILHQSKKFKMQLWGKKRNKKKENKIMRKAMGRWWSELEEKQWSWKVTRNNMKTMVTEGDSHICSQRHFTVFADPLNKIFCSGIEVTLNTEPCSRKAT